MASKPGAEVTTEDAWIGIDLGTKSVRAIAIADDGTVLASWAVPLASNRDGGRHEQDPEQWWSATRDALRQVTHAIEGRAVPSALSVCATSGTIVVADASGLFMTPGIMYDDTRAAGLASKVDEIGRAVWQRMGYRMQSSWALPKILWLADAGILRSDSAILHQADVVTSRLAGHRVSADASHALKSGADLHSVSWPYEVLSGLGLPLAAFPDMVASGEILGEVGSAAAETTGLPIGCLIIAGMTDGCAAQICAGSVRPGSWNSVMGTTFVAKGMSETALTDPTGAVYSHRAPFGAGWFPGGASNTGTRAFDHWLPGRPLGALTATAASLPPRHLYPLVGKGERFPFVSADAHAIFGQGIESGSSDSALFSAIAHGIGYLERLSYDLVSMIGYDISGPIGLTGGGSRNEWWNQLRADILDREVQTPSVAEGAIGMAVLAAAACDNVSEARLATAAERLLRPGVRLQPSPRADIEADYRLFVDELAQIGWLDPELAGFAQGGDR